MAIFTLSPIELRPHTPAPADLERLAAFAVVGAAFAFAYPKHRLAVLVLVLAFAVGLELAQHLTPGRRGRIHDVLVKAFGAALGTLVVISGERTYRQPIKPQRQGLDGLGGASPLRARKRNRVTLTFCRCLGVVQRGTSPPSGCNSPGCHHHPHCQNHYSRGRTAPKGSHNAGCVQQPVSSTPSPAMEAAACFCPAPPELRGLGQGG